MDSKKWIEATKTVESKRITFECPVKLFDEVSGYCKESGMSLSRLIRHLLREFIEKTK